jgi:hypothetical protein
MGDQRILYGTLPLVCKRWNDAAADLQTELDVHVTENSRTAISTAMWVAKNGSRLKTFRILQSHGNDGGSPYWHAILVGLCLHASRLRLKQLVLCFQSDYDRSLDALQILAPACRELTTLIVDMKDSCYLSYEESAPFLAFLGSCPELQQLRLLHMDFDSRSDLQGHLEALPWPEWPTQLTSLHVSDIKREVSQ